VPHPPLCSLCASPGSPSPALSWPTQVSAARLSLQAPTNPDHALSLFLSIRRPGHGPACSLAINCS
jgi:hypothetical protein